MKVVYDPGPNEPQETMTLGRVFFAGQAMEIDDDKLLDKLRGHPHFKVGNEKPAETAHSPEVDKRLDKAIDGRTKEAREARRKADETAAEAEAKERAAEQVVALRRAADPRFAEG